MAAMATPHGRPLSGFDATTYGDRFADVYDDWYAEVTDTDGCVTTVTDLARAVAGDRQPRVLELGVGTGRLAIPLAAAGLAVTGVDASPAMLRSLAAKPGGSQVTGVLGDMVDPPLSEEPFDLVLVAYNTLFNLVDDGAQQQCLTAAARHLGPDGVVVVEAFVPDPDATSTDSVTVREVTADRVVLSVSRTDAGSRLAVGQYVDIGEDGIKLRPWQIRWSSPDELDELAGAAGLERRHRWAGWAGEPFEPTSSTHVTVYGRG